MGFKRDNDVLIVDGCEKTIFEVYFGVLDAVFVENYTFSNLRNF